MFKHFDKKQKVCKTISDWNSWISTNIKNQFSSIRNYNSINYWKRKVFDNKKEYSSLIWFILYIQSCTIFNKYSIIKPRKWTVNDWWLILVKNYTLNIWDNFYCFYFMKVLYCLITCWVLFNSIDMLFVLSEAFINYFYL